MKIIVYDKTDSTNAVAKQMLKAGNAAPFALLAKQQTGGVGRFGRSFYSPLGGMYLSLALAAEYFKYEFGTGFIAVCLLNVIKRIINDDKKIKGLRIKWVNDIYLADKKVAGILVEKTDSHFIIGVGVNLKQTEPVPVELKDKIDFLNTDIPADKFASELIAEITKNNLTSKEVLESYLSSCKIVGTRKEIDNKGKKLIGEVVALNNDGSLSICVRNEIFKVYT